MDYQYSKEYINPQQKDMHMYNDINQTNLHRSGSPIYPVYPPHPSMQMHPINPSHHVRSPLKINQIQSPPLLPNGQIPYLRRHNSTYSNIDNCAPPPPLMNNNHHPHHLHHPMSEVGNLEAPKMQRHAYSTPQENYPIVPNGDYNQNENVPYSEIMEKRQTNAKQNTSHNLSGQKSKIQNSATKTSKVQQNGKINKQGLSRSNESAKQLDSEANKNVPPEEQNFNYYHEFCRLYTANVVLTNQLKELVGQKSDFLVKLTKLEKKSEELGDQDGDDKKKRFRRIASQIDRHYKCPHPACQKSYGSEGSLNQHLKIKHPELYQGGPTNSLMDSDRNSCYDENESFQQYQNDEDDQGNDCDGDSLSYSAMKANKKQKK